MRAATKPAPAPPGEFHFESPLHVLFERTAADHPHRIAVSFGEETLTYGELNARSNELAHWLIAMGVCAGHRIGVCLRPGLGIIIALLAIHKAGGTYLPIDPDYPMERVKSIVADADIYLTITQADVLEKCQGAFARPYGFPLQEPVVNGHRSGNPQPDLPEQATACIFYTSGTTGQPKGIPISHGSLAYYVLSAIQQFGINPEDTLLTIAKFSFSISLFDLLTSLIAGGRLVILPRTTIMDFGQLTAALEQATVVHIGPALWKGVVRYIRDHYADFRPFDGLRHVSSGGDIVPAELLEDLKTLFGHAEVYVIYGCTEIACMGCFYPAPRDAVVDRSYVGKPFPGTECVLLGEDGERTPQGEVGEVCFKGPGVMNGYLNKPELSQKAFIERGGALYFRTGDIGRIHPSGHLEFLGRRDFQIKIRGQRIELLEIESYLRRAPGVRDAILSANRTATGDNRLIAYLTVEDRDHFALEPVREHLRRFLPDYMQPSGWMILDRMPLNENLKIARRLLPAPTLENLIHTEVHVEPRTETERLLARIWQEILGLPRVGITDNFFDIGGDSLMTMNVCMLAAEQGLAISPSQLWHSPTIEQLAETCSHPAAGRREGTPLEPFSGALPDLPPFIHRFFHEAGSRTPNQWNISRMLVARRRLAPDLLEATFRHLGARHDAFRLQFERSEARWQARVMPTPEATIAFRTLDLSGLPESRQGEAIAACAKQCQESISLTRGPIASMALFEMGDPQAQRLLFIVHHFAMDVISWRNFWLEFDSVYRRFEAGGGPSVHAPSASFGEWTTLLKPYVDSGPVEADIRKWIQQDWSRVAELPKDLSREHEANTNGSAQVVHFALSEQETRWLRRNRVHGLNAERLFISGLAVALSRWHGGTVYFDRLLHGRDVAPPETDLSRTVGCLISYAPTLLDIDTRKGPEDLLRDVSAQVDKISGNHVSLYKYLGGDPALVERLNALPRPEVLFNYRGPIDDVIESGSLFDGTYTLAGLDHDPKDIRLYPLAIAVDVVKNRLEARFVYSANVHRRASIEALSLDIQQFLRSLIRP